MATTEGTEVSLDNAEEPPVLPPDDSPPAATLAADESKTPSENLSMPSASGEAEEEASKEEKPVPPVVPGLSEMLDEWQLGGLPEHKQFFSTQDNVLEAAVVAIKARLGEQDSNIRQSWLLTEVDHWDLEKERIVLLTDNNIVSVKYNFIQQQVEELKYIPIRLITEVLYGEFKYPYSYAYRRAGKGLRIYWGGKEAQLGFFTRWNPFSSNVPYTTFASHIVVRRRRLDNTLLNIATFPQELERAVNDYRAKVESLSKPKEVTEGASSSAAEFKVTEGEIPVDHYLGVSAMIHNDSYLGFFKKRGALNW